jgi:hypothetical protein
MLTTIGDSVLVFSGVRCIGPAASALPCKGRRSRYGSEIGLRRWKKAVWNDGTAAGVQDNFACLDTAMLFKLCHV